MLFGPVRSAHQVELNTAAGLLTAPFQWGAFPTVAAAKRLVTILNLSLPEDTENGKDFYRVWWWALNAHIPPATEDWFERCGAALKVASDIEAKELESRVRVAISQGILLRIKAPEKFLDAGGSEEV
jgi:hypothetical protein